MMKRGILVGIGCGLLAACSEPEEPAPEEETPPLPNTSVARSYSDPKEDADAPPEHDSGKIRVRPEKPSRKPPPVAEPLEGSPGMVVSPYNGKTIDVKGIPAGSLLSDPFFASIERKYFRVPEMTSVPAGKPVPGKAGYVFSPHTNKIIDIEGMSASSVVVDPTTPQDDRGHMRIPPEPGEDGSAR